MIYSGWPYSAISSWKVYTDDDWSPKKTSMRQPPMMSAVETRIRKAGSRFVPRDRRTTTATSLGVCMHGPTTLIQRPVTAALA
eukprot:168290-Chlamydomonas_euryale.AAC.3